MISVLLRWLHGRTKRARRHAWLDTGVPPLIADGDWRISGGVNSYAPARRPRWCGVRSPIAVSRTLRHEGRHGRCVVTMVSRPWSGAGAEVRRCLHDVAAALGPVPSAAPTPFGRGTLDIDGRAVPVEVEDATGGVMATGTLNRCPFGVLFAGVAPEDIVLTASPERLRGMELP